jgi:thiol-disulfide isomerase/thioredoxin
MMTEKNESPLLEFISSNSKKVIFVKNAKQVDDTKKNVKFIGADWCGFSKMGISQFSMACENLPDDEKCYLFDISNAKSSEAATELKIKADGFPTHVFSDGKGNNTMLPGMRTNKDLKLILGDLGFTVK